MKETPKYNINDQVELITAPGVVLTVISNSIRDQGEVLYLLAGVGAPIRENELQPSKPTKQ